MINISWKDDIFDITFPAIYEIFIGEHVYVGSTKRNGKARIKEHIKLLKAGTHYNKTMQSCFNEVGFARFMILEYPEENQVVEREQFWIDTLSPDINIIQNVANY